MSEPLLFYSKHTSADVHVVSANLPRVYFRDLKENLGEIFNGTISNFFKKVARKMYLSKLSAVICDGTMVTKSQMQHHTVSGRQKELCCSVKRNVDFSCTKFSWNKKDHSSHLKQYHQHSFFPLKWCL